ELGPAGSDGRDSDVGDPQVAAGTDRYDIGRAGVPSEMVGDQVGMGDAVGVDEDDHVHLTGRSRAKVASPGGAVAVVFLADQSHVEWGRLHHRADVGLGAVVGDDHRQLAGGTLQTGQGPGQEVGPVVDRDDD